MTWFHGYVAEVPNARFREGPGEPLTPAISVTVIATSRRGAASTYEGTVFGWDLVYSHMETWDHNPTPAELDEVIPVRFRSHSRFEIPPEFTIPTKEHA